MTRDTTKHVRIRGWTMNNLNDDGGGHQTRALTAHSPNEEGNRLNRLTDSTDDGLSVLSIMNWWWDTRRNRNTCGFSVRRLLTTTASKLSSLVMAFLIRFRRPSTPSCIGINTILTCFLCDGQPCQKAGKKVNHVYKDLRPIRFNRGIHRYLTRITAMLFWVLT